jgi:aminoglycoside phosphotransferase (APT) family kinase protein
VRFEPIARDDDAFQQPVGADQIIAMCRRGFGSDVDVESATELRGGLYNNTYLVRMRDTEPVILRVAPAASRQFRIERDLLRSEHASMPYFAPIAHLLPRTLMADSTRQIAGRDYLFQSYMRGEQASHVLSNYPPAARSTFWREVGAIAKTIHSVRGSHFGRVDGNPVDAKWSDAVLGWLTDIAADLDGVKLDATDVRDVITIAEAHRDVLDEITEPRLLHGDLWTPNLLVEPVDGIPSIVAMLDSDRTFWGDPLADWTPYQVSLFPGHGLAAFWETYGEPDRSPNAAIRSLFYQARYIGGTRLELHRLHRDGVEETFAEMRAVIEALTAVR